MYTSEHLVKHTHPPCICTHTHNGSRPSHANIHLVAKTREKRLDWFYTRGPEQPFKNFGGQVTTHGVQKDLGHGLLPLSCG